MPARDSHFIKTCIECWLAFVATIPRQYYVTHMRWLTYRVSEFVVGVSAITGRSLFVPDFGGGSVLRDLEMRRQQENWTM